VEQELPTIPERLSFSVILVVCGAQNLGFFLINFQTEKTPS
jgi:hypothetical protein